MPQAQAHQCQCHLYEFTVSHINQNKIDPYKSAKTLNKIENAI